MRLKFNVKYRRQIESGEYSVVTDNNIPVKIERWDMKGQYPILAVIETEVSDFEGEETWTEDRPYIFTEDGINPSVGKVKSLYIMTKDNLSATERMLYDKINDHVLNRETVEEEEIREWMTENFLPVLFEEIQSKEIK